MTPDEKEMQDKKIWLMTTAMIVGTTWGAVVIFLLAIIASNTTK